MAWTWPETHCFFCPIYRFRQELKSIVTNTLVSKQWQHLSLSVIILKSSSLTFKIVKVHQIYSAGQKRKVLWVMWFPASSHVSSSYQWLESGGACYSLWLQVTYTELSDVEHLKLSTSITDRETFLEDSRGCIFSAGLKWMESSKPGCYFPDDFLNVIMHLINGSESYDGCKLADRSPVSLS